MIFKYKDEIDSLIGQGLTLPPLFEPMSQSAYRYVFSVEHFNNHKPAYIKTPKRMIPGSLSTSGCALSCFNQEDKAVKRYESLRKTIPNIGRSIGDALCYGVLDANDGLITQINNEGHFDLYEFCGCELSSKFRMKKKLL